jgi:hypothetical protein
MVMAFMDANFATLALFALGLLASALPWWPYETPLPPLVGCPVAALPSLPDL